MKTLFITTHYPTPPNYGAAKRAYHLCKILEQYGSVTIVILRFPDSITDVAINEVRRISRSVKLITLKTPPPVNLRGKYERLFSYKNVGARHISISKDSIDEFIKIVKEHDLVWGHTLEAIDRTSLYSFGVPVILDLDDLNSNKLVLQANRTKGIERIRTFWRSYLWKRWENDAFNRFDAVVVCSKEDKEKFSQFSNVFVVPNGFEIPNRLFSFKKEPRLIIGFVGILNYFPNYDGIKWFVTNVLPLIIKELPQVVFRVVGKLPDKGGESISGERVELLGYLEDLDTEMKNWDLMVVPLMIGGGTRIKILEAFSKNIPVVSTTVGAYGLKVSSGKELLLADDAEFFCRHCIELINNRDFAEKITQAAHKTFMKDYTWGKAGLKVNKIVRKLGLLD